MKKIAHNVGDKEQSLLEHLENVADMMTEFCKSYDIPAIDIRKYAYQVGLSHDLGKYSEMFQRKIRNNSNIQVDHSTAGARELCIKRMPEASFAVAGHHGGIPNGRDDTKHNLIARVQRRNIDKYDVYMEELNLESAGRPKLSGFESSFFIRMLFSALVDADFLDTENFMCSGNIVRGGYDSINTLYKRTMQYIVPWLNVDVNAPEINKIRTGILKKCLDESSRKKGLFSLTVPTGGGKTVSSFSFAVKHAKENGMERIIYVIPYTSIIEQNVEVFRKIVGDKNVLSHYGNALIDLEKSHKEFYEKHKLSTENWDAPIIVTTNVQFFESLYSNKTSKCRKLHNIANSVIIFDEVQMIPLNYLVPCTRAIRSLIENYNVSAILCTATQPALEKWLSPLSVYEICDNYTELFQKLKRASIKKLGKVSEEELVDKMVSCNEVLTIVNTKKEAQQIYQKLPEEGRIHLSTNMLPAHRKHTIQVIRDRLEKGNVCRVIATSLVEAGVDIDFPIVFREEAGLDSVIQAAGRCNREGRQSRDDSVVWVFQMEEKVPDTIARNVSMMRETMQKYQEYDDLEAIHYYFSSLQMLDVETLDVHKIVQGFEKELNGIKMPFQEVSDIFHLIESDTRTLIVPEDEEASQLLDKLHYCIEAQENFRSLLRRLGNYSLNIYKNEYENMIEEGSAYELFEGVAVLQNIALYREDMGLYYEKGNGGMMI